MEHVKTDARVKPFWGRVAVAESTVDDHERQSGLILPWGTDDQHLLRGVVTDVDPDYDDGHLSALKPGMVVWYSRGRRVLDVTIVDAEHIYAYETE